jgi:dTDP-glucose pyrophosphorylase
MKELLIKENITLREALKKISVGGHRCLVVLNKYNKLLGTLSDGDLRRAIIKGRSLDSKINKIFKKKPRFFYENKIDKKKITNLFLKYKLDLVPIVNSDLKISKILHWNDFFKNKKIVLNQKTKVIITSGGKGTRLHPFTNVLPKPLIPIKDKPIISHIIDNFEKQGFKNIDIIVNYKADILKAYLSKMQTNAHLKIIHEKNPLGTAGGISLIKKNKHPMILSNCDIVTNIEFNDLLNFHKKNKFDFTIVVSTKNFSIPYGVCDLDKRGVFKKIIEKPTYDKLVSIGMYVFNQNVSSIVKKNNFLDMNQLVEKLKKMKFKIGVFPVDDTSWMDVGNWNDYNKTIDQYDRQ